MLFDSPEAYTAADRKSVIAIGMSGVGKTRLAALLRNSGAWFHYSVDYRIGTRYMGERIVDNFKREAMKNSFLRQLLMTDSICIRSNIAFNNLAPLSTYLGKPGDPTLGGISFKEYLGRQRQHREAEIAAMRDARDFAAKAGAIYGYPNFICDTSGSIAEVIDPDAPADRIMTSLAEEMFVLHIRGAKVDEEALAARFNAAPKPMYYNEDFLCGKWAEYLSLKGVAEDRVDPDDFIRWGYRQLLQWRTPRYQAIADRWGYTVEAAEIAALRSAADFEELMRRAIARRTA